jgi:hypothetical protein
MAARARGGEVAVTLGVFLLWFATLATAALALLLGFPLTVRASGHVNDEQMWAQVRAAWAWGLVSAVLSPRAREVRLFGLALPRRGKHPATEQSERKKAARRRLPSLSELREHLPVLLAASRRLLSALHVRCTVQGRAGLDDPADTAMAALWLRQAARALPAPVRISIEPEYLEPALELRSTLVARLWLGELLFVALRQWARRDVRRALRALRS